MPEKITIRLAAIDDACAFSAALKTVVEPLALYNDWAKRVEFENYAAANIPARLSADPHAILLAWAGNDIAGFLVTRADEGPLWIDWFGVLPPYRGLGVADQLFDELIAQARQRGIWKLWCDTRDTNTNAIAIMEKHGFTRVCRLQRHWFGLDFLIWEKFL